MKTLYKNIRKVILLLFLFHNITNSEISECPRNKPIFISGESKLDYCSKTQFNTSKCKILNSTIKTQWLNNIIEIGNSAYRYITFASYSNEDMIVETTCHPGVPTRMFYGLKQNGRPFFNKNEKESAHYSLNITQNLGKFEAEGSVIKLSSAEEKEYFMSISKLECNAEIINFDEDIIYYKTSTAFTSVRRVKSLRHTFIPLISTPPNNYYLFGFIGIKWRNFANKIFFQKHIFNSITEFSSTTTYQSKQREIDNAYGNEVSCFQTIDKLIICFYLTKEGENSSVFFNLHKLKEDLSADGDIILKYESNIDEEDLFNKCIHLKGEVGIFVSYTNISNIYYPFFLFMEFDNEHSQFKEYLSIESSKIILQKKKLNYYLLLNDIVKINDNKIAFSAPSKNKEILFIIIFNIYENKEVKIRYYSIAIFALYHYKIFADLRIHKYNNFLAFGFSYCKNESCRSDSDEYYSAIMIFSYPNSTDTTLNLENYLFNNNIDVNKLVIDLQKLLN